MVRLNCFLFPDGGKGRMIRKLIVLVSIYMYFLFIYKFIRFSGEGSGVWMEAVEGRVGGGIGAGG